MDEEELTEVEVHKVRWWREWRWVASLAGLLFAFGFCAFAVVAVRTSQEIESLKPVIVRLDNIATANRATLTAIETNQTGIDSLVKFVADIQAQQAANGGQSQALTQLIDLLCASTDPVRTEACQKVRSG